MKKYIQLTAGRGPVECARAVTLVAGELLKEFPDAELVESEPHNTEPDCYMSMLFLAEVDPAKEQEWSGTVLWRGVRHQTLTVPAILAGTGLSAWSLLNPSHFRMCRIKTLYMKQCAREDTEDRT